MNRLVPLYRQLHQERPNYGPGPGPNERLAISDAAKRLPKRPSRVVDWGCGNSKALMQIFPDKAIEKVCYDPAIPELAKFPEGSFDMGICTDVLEHIPEDELGEMFEAMKKLSHHWAFIVHTGLAAAILPDGQNAHCTVHDHEWWLDRIRSAFGASRALDLQLQEKDKRKGIATF